MRDVRKWVIVCEDGDEIELHRYNYAIDAAEIMLKQGRDVKLYEETTMRFIKDNKRTSEHFRIDITDRVKLMIKLNQLTKPSED